MNGNSKGFGEEMRNLVLNTHVIWSTVHVVEYILLNFHNATSFTCL